MKKDIIFLIVFLVVFVMFIFSITNLYLFTNIKNTGVFETIREYYKVDFSNVTFDLETDSYVKIENYNNLLKLRINDLNDFKNKSDITFIMENIGNKDILFKNYFLDNISSFVKEDVDINLSIDDNTIIRKGEKKEVKINIKYKGKSTKKEKYNVDINFNFEEISK